MSGLDSSSSSSAAFYGLSHNLFSSYQLAKAHEKFVNCPELGFQTLRVDIECILIVLVELYSRLDSVFEAVTRHAKALQGHGSGEQVR